MWFRVCTRVWRLVCNQFDREGGRIDPEQLPYGVSFAISSIARAVEYTLGDYPMQAIDSKSLKIRPRGCGPRLQSCDDEMGDV